MSVTPLPSALPSRVLGRHLLRQKIGRDGLLVKVGAARGARKALLLALHRGDVTLQTVLGERVAAGQATRLKHGVEGNWAAELLGALGLGRRRRLARRRTVGKHGFRVAAVDVARFDRVEAERVARATTTTAAALVATHGASSAGALCAVDKIPVSNNTVAPDGALDAGSLPWLVTFRSPFEIWHDEPTFLLCELEIYMLAILT